MEVRRKPWTALTRDEFFDIARLRSEVFFVEQRIDVVDLDEADRAADTRHYWISDGDGAAAYLRQILLPEPEHEARWSFGRVAVRRDRRGEGLARRLVAAVLADAGALPVVIHSQLYVCGLYAEFGFLAVGDIFTEAGLAHQTMIRPGGGRR